MTFSMILPEDRWSILSLLINNITFILVHHYAPPLLGISDGFDVTYVQLPFQTIMSDIIMKDEWFKIGTNRTHAATLRDQACLVQIGRGRNSQYEQGTDCITSWSGKFLPQAVSHSTSSVLPVLCPFNFSTFFQSHLQLKSLKAERDRNYLFYLAKI